MTGSGLEPLHSERLRGRRVRHAFFTRQGGVSEGIYTSLNCGRGSSDNRSHVEENRTRVAAAFNLESGDLIGPRQAHTALAVIAKGRWTAAAAPEADAVVTATPGLAISVLSADCGPVLMADVEAGVVAAVHAGWKGAKAGVLEAAVIAMEGLGAKRGQIAAAIGPTIGPRDYEVGFEFKSAFVADNASNAAFFTTDETSGRPHFDLSRYILARLSAFGVMEVTDLAVSTYENESILFSHRRSFHRGEPDYGRQISAIVLT